MIQRIQSIYLGMVCIMTGGFLNLPYYQIDGKLVFPVQNIVLASIVGLVALVAVITIFLYKNRKLQMKMAILGIVLSVLTLGISLLDFWNFEPQTIQGKSFMYGLIFPFAMILLFFLAWRGINKDEKLVRSMDRLR